MKIGTWKVKIMAYVQHKEIDLSLVVEPLLTSVWYSYGDKNFT